MKKTMRQVLRIGSRGSKLALWQAEFIKYLILDKFPELEIRIIVIKTAGDKHLEPPLSIIGGKGVFVKEIEESLLMKEIDLAVHSMKDLPAVLPDGLIIGAVPERGDPRDALVSNGDIKFNQLRQGARVGTGSLRRRVQLLRLKPDIEIVPIRGNVDTRIRRLRNGDLDSIVLAMAGLERMGLIHEVTESFPVEVMIPAPGQGIIAVECRDSDSEVKEILSEINHRETGITALAERSFLERLGGSCDLPAGCYASVEVDNLKMIGFVASADGRDMVRGDIEGQLDDKFLGKMLAERILKDGGEEIISRLSS